MASQKEIQEQNAKIALFRSQMTHIVSQMEELFAAVNESRSSAAISIGTEKVERDMVGAEMVAKRALKDAQDAADTGFVNGVPATFDDVKALTVRLGKAIDAYTKTVDAWNATFLTDQLVPLVNSVRESVTAIVQGVAGTVGLARYLPYALVGGAVLLFVVPPLLRLIRAGRQGGADAILDTGIDQLESGRRVLRSAGSAAGRGAQLYLTKGMAGGPKARRSKR